MKQMFAMIALLLATACHQNHSNDQQSETYALFKMTRKMSGGETTALAYQEKYELKPDGHFIRTRVEQGSEQKLKGTYEWKKEGQETHLVLTYDRDSPLIGNCTGGLEESFFRYEMGKLQNNWMACDGPGLYYKKKK